MAALEALRSYRAGNGFNFSAQVAAILSPQSLGTWTTFAGILLLAITAALMTAATLVARRGLAAANGPVESTTRAPHERAPSK
jgi:hypothetical protein